MWLTGIGLVFQIIFYIIVGAGCILFAVFGGAHYVATMMTHDVERCSCQQCQMKRQKAWRKVHGNPMDVGMPPAQPKYEDQGGWWIDDKKKEPMGETWVSTVELQEGMYVLGKASGSLYKVETIDAREYGFVVILVNVTTQAKSWVRIGTDSAHKLVWLTRPTRKRK